MTVQQKLQRLQNSPIIAYPTAMTYDMGMEYEIISKDGFCGNMGLFANWPLYQIKIDPNLTKVIERIKQQRICKVDLFKETNLESIVGSTKDELDSLANVIFELPSEAEFLFAIVTNSGNENKEYFANQKDASNAFVDQYGYDFQSWDNMSDNMIEYLYDMAEEQGWKMVFIQIGFDENNVCDNESVSKDSNNEGERLYRQACGAMELKQIERANDLLQKAVTLGNSDAMEQLASNLMDGYGIAPNKKTALNLWLKSANLGNPKAQFNVAMGYAQGSYTGSSDYKTSQEWCLKSATQGYADAIANMGQYYLYGHGVEKDYEKAFMWFKKGCDAGATGIYLFFLGYCYEEGLGVDKNFELALNYYKASGNIPYSKAGIKRLEDK